MGVFSKLARFFKRGQDFTPEDRRRMEEVREQIRSRCGHFRCLLAANKKALETMSEVEEHLTGSRPFGMGYVKESGARTAAAVYQMIREFSNLTKEPSPQLQDAFSRVSNSMEGILAPAPQAPEGPLVLPLRVLGLAYIQEVGGKMANLGEVASGAGLSVPSGFAVTVSAYRLFMRENNLSTEFEQRIRSTDMDNMDALFTLSAGLQQAILAADLPQRLAEAIESEVEKLLEQEGDPDIRLALRSSAVGEDALGASFAGQYRSELNVLPDEVCDTWKEIIASKYTVTALSYRYQRGIPDEAAPMSVGVLRMVKAFAGGVAYSVDPVNGGEKDKDASIVLNAVPGLPAAVVDGGITPDTFVFTHTHPARLVERHIPVKATRMDSDYGSATGIRMTTLSPEEGSLPSIDDHQAAEVARITLALEEYYNEPQDVEWALEKTAEGERVIVLQSRPLQLVESGADSAPDNEGPVSETAEVALSSSPVNLLMEGGIAVSRGVGIGPVFVARRDADMLFFPVGSILVVERAHPRWAPLLPRAAGMISETGGMAGHLASVAREYGVPALFGLEGALARLADAGVVTLDATRKRVLAGEHPELKVKEVTPARLMAGSPVMHKLEELAECMIPLHLLDPDSPDFSPEHCLSLHDLTRYCHEKAARFMFGGNTDLSRSMGRQLKAGVKLQYWVIDMEDGFTKEILGPVVDIDEIASKPMLALWGGMCAVPWAGPPSASASGLMSIVFESTMNPELEVTAANTMAERNYFIISKNYMLLQARYGYHFCTVETLATSDAQENFVSFQFKGGAADMNRRKLRARMIADLLESQGFRADVRGDSMFAVSEGCSEAETILKTRLVGYLLIHTRQSDMIMADEGQAEAFRNKLASDMAGIVAGSR